MGFNLAFKRLNCVLNDQIKKPILKTIGKGKSKVHSSTGTETLYGSHGP